MEWKNLLNLENFSFRNPLARIFYSSATLGTAVFLSQIPQSSGGDATSLVLALATTPILTEAFKSLGGEALGEAVSDRFFKNYRRKYILENGDLQKAVGDAICVTVLQVYKAKNPNANQKILRKLSNVPVSVWLDLVVELENEEDKDIGISLDDIDKLLPRNLIDIFAVRATEFNIATEFNKATLVDRNTWRKILRKFCVIRGISTSNEDNSNFTDTIELAAIELEKNFPESLKHAIISNVTNDHKAYANLQLKINGEILYFVRQNDKKTDKILEIVNSLEKRNTDLETIFLSENFVPSQKFFEDAYNLEKNIFDLLSSVKSDTTEILAILKERETTKTSIQKFFPTIFPKPPRFFTGRKDVLEKIRSLFEIDYRVCLHDISGIGKSAVAKRYAEKSEENYDYIFFFDAINYQSSETLSEICKELLNDLSPESKIDEILKSFQRWLAKNKNWLVIFDNVEDVDDIYDFTDELSNGHFLLTSRFREIEDYAVRVEIKKFEDKDSKTLLYRRGKNQPDAKFEDTDKNEKEAIEEIVSEFDGLPLALNICGAYIQQKQISFSKFSKDISKSFDKRDKYKLVVDGVEYKSFGKIFEMTFQTLITPENQNDTEEKIKVEAIEILFQIVSFLSPNAISQKVLSETLEVVNEKFTCFTSDSNNWDKFRKDLIKYDLLQFSVDDETFKTHRLIQKMIEKRYFNQRQMLEEPLSQVLADNFEHFDFTNKDIVEEYLPHVEIFLANLEENAPTGQVRLRLENLSTAKLCNSYSHYFIEFGQYQRAETYCLLFKKICEGNNDIPQELLTSSYNNLAEIYRHKGEYEKAEPLYLEALRLTEKQFGEDFPLAGIIYINLAGVYEKLGKGDKNEAILKLTKLIEMKEGIFGENHTQLARDYNNLAVHYLSVEKYDEAEILFLKTKNILEESQDNRIDLAPTYDGLAKIFERKGNFKESELLRKKALEIQEEWLGENHPESAKIYSDLGLAYVNQGDYENAELYYQKALELQKISFGENSTEIVTTYNNLAGLRETQERITEAKELFNKARLIQEKFFGENHFETAIIYYNLGNLLAKQEERDEAREVLNKALTIFQNTYGDEHFYTTQTVKSLEFVNRNFKLAIITYIEITGLYVLSLLVWIILIYLIYRIIVWLFF